MKRYDCLKIVADEMSDALVICTVGGAAAEWNSIRPSDGNLRCRTLGLVSSIAMGLALTLPKPAHRRHRWRRRAADERVRACHPGLAESCQLDVVAVRQRYLRSLRFEADGDDSGADLIAMAKGAGVKNASWTASLDDYRNALRKAKESGALSMIGAQDRVGSRIFQQLA